jgi:sulfatase modifying factor 1
MNLRAESPANPQIAKSNGPNGHKLVIVPAGQYAVGEKSHGLNPYRRVSLESYRIADAETTNAQFSAFVSKTKYVSEAEKRGSSLVFRTDQPEWRWVDAKGAHWRCPQGPDDPFTAAKNPDYPVTQISLVDAEAYCRWVGGRLPTHVEWEVAARGGSVHNFPWGSEYDPKLANIWNGTTHRKDSKLDGFEFLAPVRSFPANAWGLHDVIGNVFEYVSDLPYGTKPNPSKPVSAARGGSWWCSKNTCRFFNLVDTGTMLKNASLPNQGFRVVFPPQDHMGSPR